VFISERSDIFKEMRQLWILTVLEKVNMRIPALQL
jgi:hypothetical protein